MWHRAPPPFGRRTRDFVELLSRDLPRSAVKHELRVRHRNTPSETVVRKDRAAANMLVRIRPYRGGRREEIKEGARWRGREMGRPTEGLFRPLGGDVAKEAGTPET